MTGNFSRRTKQGDSLPDDGKQRNARGNIIPEAGVRLRMAQLVVDLAKAHDEAGEGDPLMATATFVNGTLVVTVSGQQAHDLADWCRALGIADPERFTGTNWPKPEASDG